MEKRLEKIEKRIRIHVERLPIMIQRGAPEIIVMHEQLIIERLCGDYAAEYLGGVVLRNFLGRYCKGCKQTTNKGTINGHYPPGT